MKLTLLILFTFSIIIGWAQLPSNNLMVQNRVKSIIIRNDKDSSTEYYSYDREGLLTSQRKPIKVNSDFINEVTIFLYDKNRVLSKTILSVFVHNNRIAGGTTYYNYDKAGRLVDIYSIPETGPEELTHYNYEVGNSKTRTWEKQVYTRDSLKFNGRPNPSFYSYKDRGLFYLWTYEREMGEDIDHPDIIYHFIPADFIKNTIQFVNDKIEYFFAKSLSESSHFIFPTHISEGLTEGQNVKASFMQAPFTELNVEKTTQIITKTTYNGSHLPLEEKKISFNPDYTETYKYEYEYY